MVEDSVQRGLALVPREINVGVIDRGSCPENRPPGPEPGGRGDLRTMAMWLSVTAKRRDEPRPKVVFRLPLDCRKISYR
jgi:hypothetical protein